jgi:hypothetical protein
MEPTGSIPHPDAPVTSIYVRKSAFAGDSVPKRVVLTLQGAEA